MSSLTAIDGLVSGLNTTEIVDAIIQYERRNAVYLEYEKADKTNIVSSLKAFEAKLLALKTSVARLTKQKGLKSFKKV